MNKPRENQIMENFFLFLFFEKIPGDTIKLKLGGDGHIVTHQYSHVMFTVCLLNEKDDVLKPDHQYW